MAHSLPRATGFWHIPPPSQVLQQLVRVANMSASRYVGKSVGASRSAFCVRYASAARKCCHSRASVRNPHLVFKNRNTLVIAWDHRQTEHYSTLEGFAPDSIAQNSKYHDNKLGLTLLDKLVKTARDSSLGASLECLVKRKDRRNCSKEH